MFLGVRRRLEAANSIGLEEDREDRGDSKPERRVEGEVVDPRSGGRSPTSAGMLANPSATMSGQRRAEPPRPSFSSKGMPRSSRAATRTGTDSSRPFRWANVPPFGPRRAGAHLIDAGEAL